MNSTRYSRNIVLIRILQYSKTCAEIIYDNSTLPRIPTIPSNLPGGFFNISVLEDLTYRNILLQGLEVVYGKIDLNDVLNHLSVAIRYKPQQLVCVFNNLYIYDMFYNQDPEISSVHVDKIQLSHDSRRRYYLFYDEFKGETILFNFMCQQMSILPDRYLDTIEYSYELRQSF